MHQNKWTSSHLSKRTNPSVHNCVFCPVEEYLTFGFRKNVEKKIYKMKAVFFFISILVWWTLTYYIILFFPHMNLFINTEFCVPGRLNCYIKCCANHSWLHSLHKILLKYHHTKFCVINNKLHCDIKLVVLTSYYMIHSMYFKLDYITTVYIVLQYIAQSMT